MIDEPSLTAPGPVAGLEAVRHVPPHLFDEWPTIRQRLRSAGRIILFLDFDGTLTPIRSHPAEVSLHPATRSCLERLVSRPDVTVSIITGRRQSDVHRRVGVVGIEYLGVHGGEGRTSYRTPAASLELMRRARQFLEPPLSSLPGIWIEDKGPAMTVHYRKAKRVCVPWARTAVQALLRIFEPDLRMVSGKKAWEIFPRNFPGKRGAVQAILAGCPPDTLPICVGDDAADEPVFRFLEDGVTVRVGRKARTYAQYGLAGPSEVRQFLQRIDAEAARRPRSLGSTCLPLLT